MTPELVEVHGPVPTDTADAGAAAVAAVHLQQFEHIGSAARVLAQESEVDVGAVAVVVHGQALDGLAALVQGAGAVHDQVHRGAGLGVAQVFLNEMASPARIDEVVEADAGDPLLFEEVEDAADVLDIAAVHGEAQAHLDPAPQAGADAGEGQVKGARDAAEAVVGLLESVEADADVGEVDLLEPGRHLVPDQGAVGGDDGAQVAGAGVGNELEDVGAHQGFAAGEEDDRHAEVGEVIDQAHAFLGREFAGVVDVPGVGIAVHAAQVAAAPHVPDDHGLLVLGELQQVRRQLAGVAPIAQGVGGFDGTAVELGDADHGVLLFRLAVSAASSPGTVASRASRPMVMPSARAVRDVSGPILA